MAETHSFPHVAVRNFTKRHRKIRFQLSTWSGREDWRNTNLDRNFFS